MRYYVTVRIKNRLSVIGEVVADVNPIDDPNYIWPYELAKGLADDLEVDLSPEFVTAEALDDEDEGARALRDWRAGDDSGWEVDRMARNTEFAMEGTREDIEMFARRGDPNAALLLREGSFIQQREYLEAEATSH
jgi:hypothetical protein